MTLSGRTSLQGAQHIASILARAPSMQDFRMASSRVGPQGGAALAQALSAAGTQAVTSTEWKA